MHLDVGQLVLLGLLSAAGHWILSRSRIAQPLWSRARGLTDDFLRCAGCVGFWIGLVLGLLGLRPVTGSGWRLIDVSLTALTAVFLTPVFEGVLIWGRDASAIPDIVTKKPDPKPPDPIPDLTSDLVSDRVSNPKQA